MKEATFSTVEIDELALRTATWGSGAPEIIMLHDGLGSITQWRDVPAGVEAATGNTVMAYERAGHGESRPIPTGPWPTDWLQTEATVLLHVIEASGASRPVLVGHSDGGSTALIHAARADSAAGAVVAIAPHSWVEQICFDSIVAMRANRAPIVAGLERHHHDGAALFEAWSGVWVSDGFRSWDIRGDLATISVPTLVAQGRNDAYASEAQAHLTAEAVGDLATSRIVPDVGHIMHHDDSAVVVDLITDFVLGL